MVFLLGSISNCVDELYPPVGHPQFTFAFRRKCHRFWDMFANFREFLTDSGRCGRELGWPTGEYCILIVDLFFPRRLIFTFYTN